MEKKDIKKVIESVTDYKMAHMNSYTKSEVEESLTEALHQAFIKSGVRTSCFKEVFEMWFKCESEKEFIRWVRSQLHES